MTEDVEILLARPENIRLTRHLKTYVQSDTCTQSILYNQIPWSEKLCFLNLDTVFQTGIEYRCRKCDVEREPIIYGPQRETKDINRVDSGLVFQCLCYHYSCNWNDLYVFVCTLYHKKINHIAFCCFALFVDLLIITLMYYEMIGSGSIRPQAYRPQTHFDPRIIRPQVQNVTFTCFARLSVITSHHSISVVDH